jgi:hypothetical protein
VLSVRRQAAEAEGAVMSIQAGPRHGFVKLYRALLDTPIWASTPEAWGRVFITLLLLVNWKPAKWWNGQRDVAIQPGQLATSVQKLAEISRVTPKQVRGCLEYLKKANMVAIETAKQHTVITLLNWDTYQAVTKQEGEPNGQPDGDTRASEGQVKGNNRRREESKKYFSEDDIFLTQLSLDGGLVGDEFLVPIRVLRDENGDEAESFSEALYRAAEAEELHELIEDGCGGSVSGEGYVSTRKEYQRLMDQNFERLDTPKDVQAGTPQRAREVAA